MPFRMFHVGDLLGKTARCEKIDTRFVVTRPDNQSNGFQAISDGLDILVIHTDSFLLYFCGVDDCFKKVSAPFPKIGEFFIMLEFSSAP